MTNEDLSQIQSLVNGARRVLVLTHKNPSIDTMASALALYLAMQRAGKDATIAMEAEPLVEVANLVGIDKVQTTLPGKNLTLTYKPYTLGDFEKVTALENPAAAGSSDQDSFTMTIIAKNGVLPDPKSFSFNYLGGGAADLVITVDVLEPTALGALYDPSLFSGALVINIDNHDPNKDYGKFNLVEPEAASISEIVTFFLRAVSIPIDADISHNLYEGIKSATGNFQSPKIAAASFEAAAICLRAAAKKAEPVSTNAQPTPSQQPAQQPNAPQPAGGGQVPKDWTQPKIFSGGTRV